MPTPGRESLLWSQAGYRRYRKIYAGADHLLISGVTEPGYRTQQHARGTIKAPQITERSASREAA